MTFQQFEIEYNDWCLIISIWEGRKSHRQKQCNPWSSVNKHYNNTFSVNKDGIYVAQEHILGGYILDETKLGKTLWLLAGGDSCDLGV